MTIAVKVNPAQKKLLKEMSRLGFYGSTEADVIQHLMINGLQEYVCKVRQHTPPGGNRG